MPKREDIVLLEDIRQFIEDAEKVIIEVGDFEKYKSSKINQWAFERLFELIGEALYKLRKERKDINITDLNKIIGLRHIIAHEYYGLDTDRLWVIATTNLPLLKTEIEQLIQEENQRLFGTTNPDLE